MLGFTLACTSRLIKIGDWRERIRKRLIASFLFLESLNKGQLKFSKNKYNITQFLKNIFNYTFYYLCELFFAY